MRLRKAMSDVLYEIASAITQFADAITPSSDEVWRERRWKQFEHDQAKSLDGPPLTSEPVTVVAVRTQADPPGLFYFDAVDWPMPGFSLLKMVTGATADQLRRG